MNPMQPQMHKPTIYPSFMNTSFNPQLDTTLNIPSNVNVVQDIPVVLDSMSQTTPTLPTMPLNNQSNLNIQAMTPCHSFQSVQNYHSSSLAHPQENAFMGEYSFFYAPCNDFQMYHIICEEIPLSFELVSQLINDIDNDSTHNYVQANNIYIFYHKQHETKKIYQVTCEMVSHTFMFQFLNKIIYGIQSVQSEYQQQKFSKRHQENLKFHLKKDLTHYLSKKQDYEQNYNLFKEFIRDYYTYYKNMINSYNVNDLSCDQIFTSQQDNGYVFQNGEDDYNQDYYNNDCQPY